MSEIPIIILCGGRGTRIRDVSEDIPKPMIEIGNRPILWHIMRSYAHYGFKKFVLLLGYKGHIIKQYFLNYHLLSTDVEVTLGRPPEIVYKNSSEELNWKITLAETGMETQTGGRVYQGATRYGKGATFMVTYGDGLSNLDIQELLFFHRSHGKMATVTGVRPPGRFGEIEIQDHQVVEFNEKPQVSSGYINGGFFVFEWAFVEKYMNDNPALILEAEPLQKAARDGDLMVFKHHGFWQPMDTYREWKILNALWNSGKAPWKK